jgi:hypothetical protein
MMNRKILGIMMVSLFSLTLVGGSTAMASNDDPANAACCPGAKSKTTQKSDAKCAQVSKACCPEAGDKSKCAPCPEPSSGSACCPEKSSSDAKCCPQDKGSACCPSAGKTEKKDKP